MVRSGSNNLMTQNGNTRARLSSSTLDVALVNLLFENTDISHGSSLEVLLLAHFLLNFLLVQGYREHVPIRVLFLLHGLSRRDYYERRRTCKAARVKRGRRPKSEGVAGNVASGLKEL